MLACSLLPLSGCSQLSRLELEGLTGNASGTLGHALPMLTCLLDLRLSFSAELRTSELLASLCHVFSLQTLHLAFVPPLPDPAVLASSLRQLQGLTHLELACAHARAYNLDAIAPALPSLVNLQELVLESLQWSEVLLGGLSALPALRMLDLRNGNHPLPDGSAEQDPRLPHSSCAALLRALSGPLRSRLRKLTLYNMVPYMSPFEAVAQLGVALGSLPHLEVLYAWTAPDEYECAEQAPAVFAALAPGLACAPLRELQLGCSRMNERGLQALAECIALEGCPLRSTLRTLSLAEAFYELRDDEQQPASKWKQGPGRFSLVVQERQGGGCKCRGTGLLPVCRSRHWCTLRSRNQSTRRQIYATLALVVEHVLLPLSRLPLQRLASAAP